MQAKERLVDIEEKKEKILKEGLSLLSEFKKKQITSSSINIIKINSYN